jgi:hypothetical protein
VKSDPPDPSRLEQARDYLADFLYDEDFHGDAGQDWFIELSGYVDQLSADDPLIVKAAVYLQPFLDDDDRIECAMYPGGECIRFIEQRWGGDLRSYLAGLVDAMGRDHARWGALLADQGQAARWTLGR